MQNRPGPDIVAGNRLMIQGDRHYDYDAFGNLIRERRGKGHQLVTEYRYDCQHRLIGVTTPNGQTASYRYDPFGRRLSKTVDGLTTEFCWQGDKLIADYEGMAKIYQDAGGNNRMILLDAAKVLIGQP